MIISQLSKLFTKRLDYWKKQAIFAPEFVAV